MPFHDFGMAAELPKPRNRWKGMFRQAKESGLSGDITAGYSHVGLVTFGVRQEQMKAKVLQAFRSSSVPFLIPVWPVQDVFLVVAYSVVGDIQTPSNWFNFAGWWFGTFYIFAYIGIYWE